MITEFNKAQFLFLALVFVALANTTFAQTAKPNYALLWEISGNGLDQPSYLFGTMHLRDNRVFEFSDSVLLKLDQCTAFASEVRIDSSICQTLQLYEYGDTTNILKKKLPPYTYRKINEAVYEKTGWYIEDLEVKHPQRIESLLSDDTGYLFNEDRDAELDLYLFQRAFVQGKALYGLEYEKDYEKLVDDYFREFEINYNLAGPYDEEKEADYSTRLIEFYRQGNLDSVAAYSITSEHYSTYDYEMINGRNKTMLKNLLPLLQKHSVFVAVGAAHLPGEEGLIALLEEAGYSVKMVPATFNGPAEPPIKEKKTISWHLTSNEKDGYEFITPGIPFKVHPAVPGENITRQAYYFFDVPTQVIYSARSSYYPLINSGLKKQDVFTEILREWLFKRQPARHPMTIDLNLEEIRSGNYTGVITQLEVEPGLHERIALFLEKNTLYFFLVEGKEEDIFSEAVDLFFSSIVIKEPVETDWQTFESETGGFSISFPQEPTLELVEIPYETDGNQHIDAKVFMAKDLDKGHTYLLRYFDYPVGVGVVDSELFFESQIAELSRRYQDLEPEVTDVLLDGLLFKKIELDYQNIIFHFWTGFQGNRTYMLMAVPSIANRSRPDIFDNWAAGLRLEPVTPGPVQQREIKEMELSLPLPNEPFFIKKDGSRFSFPIEYSFSYGVLDTTSGISMLISKGELHRYAWLEGMEGLRSAASEIEESEFTILYSKDTIFKGLPAVQSVFVYPGTGNASLSLLTMHGPTYHEFLINLPENLLGNSTIAAILEGIEFENEKFDSSIFKSKGQFWLSDLMSENDSLVMYAKETAEFVKLQATDLPLLYDILGRAIPNDTIGARRIKELLFEKLEKYQDASTFQFLKELYPSLALDEKINLLTTLTWTEDVRGKQLFFELVKDLPQGAISYPSLYTLFQPFREQPEVSMSYIHSLMELWEYPALQTQLAMVLFTLTQNEQLEFTALQDYADAFMATTRQYADAIDWSREPQDGEDPQYQTLYYLCSSILKSLNKSPELVSILRNLEARANPEILAALLPSLTALDEKMSKSSIEKVQTDSTEWVFYLKALQADGNLQKLPSRYKKQEEFLPYYLRYYGLFEDELDYKDIRFFINTEKEWQGQQYTIYLFKMHIMVYGQKDQYWGIVSQPADKKELNTSPEILYFYPFKKDSRSQKEVLEDIWEDYLKGR